METFGNGLLGLLLLVFVFHRVFAAEGAVEPLSVVAGFDPLEDRHLRVRPCGIGLPVQEFRFQRTGDPA